MLIARGSRFNYTANDRKAINLNEKYSKRKTNAKKTTNE